MDINWFYVAVFLYVAKIAEIACNADAMLDIMHSSSNSGQSSGEIKTTKRLIYISVILSVFWPIGTVFIILGNLLRSLNGQNS